jgi:Rho termination factor, N-terminal domain
LNLGIAMPQWTDKDKRQYEHIKENELVRGKSVATAKEVAARTVNKQRREEGRTPNHRTQGTGNPNTLLEERSVDELRNRAAALKIKGRSKMNKAELIAAIRVVS